MAITPQEDLNQFKSVVFILEIDIVSSCFFQSLSQISDDKTSIWMITNYMIFIKKYFE
jgi:hypothetical protein